MTPASTAKQNGSTSSQLSGNGLDSQPLAAPPTEILRKFIPPKKHLGVSQFASAIGVSPWMTAVELKEQLEKGYYWEQKAATQYGYQMESVAKYYYTKITGNALERAKSVTDPECIRLVGMCDGLIVGENAGVEIKCHYSKKEPIGVIPIDYLVQLAGYMYLYDKEWFDFMSCVFEDNVLKKTKIIRVQWSELEEAWNKEWYPKLLSFVAGVKWVT